MATKNIKFHLPSASTNLFKRDIVYATSFGNSAPSDVRSKKSFPRFKAAYSNYLLHIQQKDVFLHTLVYFLFI